MRIAVCDDDQNFCKEMLKYLQGYFKEKKLKQPEYVCFSSGEAMMKAGGIFDMAFLDVEMDGISGIHAGEYLKKKNDKILIFIVTSFPEYLDEACHSGFSDICQSHLTRLDCIGIWKQH